MRQTALYRKYFKNNVFMRFILIFSVISIATIIAFSTLVLLLISQSSVQRQMDIQRRVMESISLYIENKYESVQSIVRDIYRDEGLAGNTSYLLENPYADYVKYRLDRFFADNKSSSDVVQFFKNKVEDDPDIRSLILYSANQQTLYAYNSVRQFEIIPTNASRSYVPDTMYLDEDNYVSLPNIWVRQTIGLDEAPMFSVRLPISNKLYLRNIGQMLVYFDSNAVWESVINYKNDFKGTLLVLSSSNDVLFDTSGKWYGRKYPYFQSTNASFEERMEMDGNIFTRLTHGQGGFTVVSMVPKEELAASYRGARNTIAVIAMLCILVAVLLPSLFITSFAKRTHQIIRFTRKVKNGDLGARITDKKEDELGQIAKSFNDMLDELNQYIDRVYKAEIKQKHTEIAALEARVNPHFLYNTLEAIRMRAISQGAGDVGEMIYSLSVLFKSYVRQKPHYTMKDELEACRLYLELFRIRYKDRISYGIQCERGLEARTALKMSLQPIIENYILHGMRTDRSDNRIDITVIAEQGNIKVTVRDNGRGIEAERLEMLRANLETEGGLSESFGLRSIHERLRLMYGKPYGLEVDSKPGEGTTVTVLFPDPGKGEI